MIGGERVRDLEKPEWAEYRFAFDALPKTPITRLAFSFEVAEGECAGVNIDRLYLVP